MRKYVGFKILFVICVLVLAKQPAHAEDAEKSADKKQQAVLVMPKLDIELQAIRSGYDRKTCLVHPRPGLIPGKPATVVVTMQELLLSGSDIYNSQFETVTKDGGKTWSAPVELTETLGRRRIEKGMDENIADFWPMWHKKTGVLLGTGHTVRYLGERFAPAHSRSTAYSVYNARDQTWSRWQELDMPPLAEFTMEGAGSTQRVDLPNGEILLPIYYSLPGTIKDVFTSQNVSMVVRCAFDGTTLKYLEHGDAITTPSGRGFSEPSLVHFNGRYHLTLRNDAHSYVCTGTDGLHFGKPQLWTFDDGTDLGSYNTQQHWVTMPDAPYLVYTRRGAKNDHVFRHRAPLFIAQVDPERMCVIRKTEQVLVPERGARLGNFGIAKISDTESWVTVAEWMQTTSPNPHDSTVCEKYGSDNTVWLAKIRAK
tara:strand:- start:35783 stop:37057 length:1275 start_codon:yes stop_codon:yes gene_type:complete